MRFRKYNEQTVRLAIKRRKQGWAIPDIVAETGINSHSLKKLFHEHGIKLDTKSFRTAIGRRWKDYNPIKSGEKRCSNCRVCFPLEHFSKAKSTLTGLSSRCKGCQREDYLRKAEIVKDRVARYRTEHPEKIKARDARYYRKNKKRLVEKSILYARANPEYRRQIRIAYEKRYPWKKRERTARYRAALVNATPRCLTKEQIAEMQRIYSTCPKGHHVDHMVPIRARDNFICGLHVPWNLRPLPAIENMRKSNKLLMQYLTNKRRSFRNRD